MFILVNSMKKVLSIFLISVMSLALASCGAKNTQSDTTSAADTEVASEVFSTPIYETGLEYDYDDLSEYITLPKHTGLTLDVELTAVTEEDVDNILRQALISAGTSTEVTDGAEEGDTVAYTSTATRCDNGNLLESGASRTVTIGDSVYLDGFTENFIGVKTGDAITFTYTFPDDYSQDDLCGVSASYSCEITSVSFVTEPDFTDEWVLSQDIDGVTTTDDYREYLEIGLEETAKDNNAQTLRSAVQAVIEDGAEVLSYPQKEYDYYISLADKTASSYASVNGISVEAYIEQTYGSESAFEEYKEGYAEDNVKSDLIVWYIVRETGVSVDPTEYKEQMEYGYETYASSYGIDSKENFEKAFGASVTRGLLYASALDKLVETCKY